MLTCKAVNTGGLGRFGNQLFSIASTIGIAIKNGQPYAFPQWINQDNALFGGKADVMEDYFDNSLPALPEGLHFEDIPYHWEYRDYNVPTGNWNICSHLQDPRYFSHCMDTIRHYFRMKDEPEQNEYVALHYRAGDYIDDPAAYHPRCDRDYYERAIAQFPKGTPFMIFSDDKAEAYKVMAKFISLPMLSICSNDTDGSYLKDFRLMKRCKSFICANSSFSYMAALLGEHPEKKIIMPRRWFGSSAGISFGGYPENAIIL